MASKKSKKKTDDTMPQTEPTTTEHNDTVPQEPATVNDTVPQEPKKKENRVHITATISKSAMDKIQQYRIDNAIVSPKDLSRALDDAIMSLPEKPANDIMT